MKADIYATSCTKVSLEKAVKEIPKNEYGKDYYSIEVNTLEDLIDIIKESDSQIILSMFGGELSIEIYDSYRE